MAREWFATRFAGGEIVAPLTGRFAFERPPDHTFAPGQYFALRLPTGQGEQTKPFSYAAAPGEPAIELATRLTGSAFKRALEALAPGDRVEISGPSGRPALPEGAPRAAFLVGGVGVTPARSVLRDALRRRTGLEAVVFYGNRDIGSIPFAAEMSRIAAESPAIRVIDVLEHPPADWEGETGYISEGLVRRHIEPGDGWHFVVAGPPAMFGAMRGVLEALGVDPERVSATEFAGYG